MKFKSGDIVYIIITGELGFILRGEEVSTESTFKYKYEISVPRILKGAGIEHGQILSFYEEELETPRERISRELDLRIFEFELKSEWERAQIAKRKQLKEFEDTDGGDLVIN